MIAKKWIEESKLGALPTEGHSREGMRSIRRPPGRANHCRGANTGIAQNAVAIKKGARQELRDRGTFEDNKERERAAQKTAGR